MKKLCVAFLLLATASFVHASDLGFSLVAGLGTDQSFSFNPIILTGTGEFQFKLGGILMFCPEATVLTTTKFKDFILIPAVCLNVTPGPLYFGGGIAKAFVLGDTYSSDFMLKLNAGFRAGGIRIGAYMLTSLKTPFDYAFYGFQIGFDI